MHWKHNIQECWQNFVKYIKFIYKMKTITFVIIATNIASNTMVYFYCKKNNPYNPPIILK